MAVGKPCVAWAHPPDTLGWCSEKDLLFRISFPCFTSPIAQFLSRRKWNWSVSRWIGWDTCVNSVASCFFRFVSRCFVLPVAWNSATAKDQRPDLKLLKKNLKKKGRRVRRRLVPPPADHFPYHRQVYPFIVMKWGKVMYSECERLNPALAFLWGRQSRADIRSEWSEHSEPPDAREPSIKLRCWESTTHT